jgi:Putative cyclase
VEEGACRSGRSADRGQWRTVREVFVAETDEEAWKLSVGGMMGRRMSEYFLPPLANFGYLDYLKHAPDVPDSDVTPEYCAKYNWLIGSPSTVAEKLEAVYESVGGFGQLLVFGFDYMENPEAWHTSLGLLMNVVMPKVQHLAAKVPAPPRVVGKNKIVWHDEFLATEIGQVGTQFDDLGHIGAATGEPGDKAAMRFYNGVTEMEMASATGLQKLGVEKVKPLLTRGIVLDMAGLKGRMLRECEEITVARSAHGAGVPRSRGGVITPGDAVLIHTGWGDLWMKTTPGTGPANRGSAWRRRSGSRRSKWP